MWLSHLELCSDHLASSCTKVDFGISLEQISQILEIKWGYFVTFDSSGDLYQNSWIDLRVWYYQKSAIENLRVAANRFPWQQRGLAMFEMFKKLFGDFYHFRKRKQTGCSIDDFANMTGHISKVFNLIQEVFRLDLVWVWCMLHEIDIVMQKVHKDADWFL